MHMMIKGKLCIAEFLIHVQDGPSGVREQPVNDWKIYQIPFQFLAFSRILWWEKCPSSSAYRNYFLICCCEVQIGLWFKF